MVIIIPAILLICSWRVGRAMLAIFTAGRQIFFFVQECYRVKTDFIAGLVYVCLCSMLGLMMLVTGHETLMQQSVMCPPQPVPSVPRPRLALQIAAQLRPQTQFFTTHPWPGSGGQGMVTGQVTKTTHCTYQLAGTCHLVSIQGLSISILVQGTCNI